MHTSHSGLAWQLAVAAVAASILLSAEAAHAAITGASGRVEAVVQQTNATTGQTIDQAIEETPGTTNILPATAQATLNITTSTNVQGRLACTAAVDVPGENAAQDTSDFTLEAAGLSLLEGRGFTSNATATQTRQITLSAAELNRRSGSQVRIRSNFVIDSGIFLVTRPNGPTDVIGRIEFSIQQQDPDGSREVLAGSIAVSFDADGNLQTTAAGDLVGVTPLAMNLAGTSGKVQQAQLVLLPAVTIPYEYQAVVDRPFTLVAQVKTNITSATGNQAGSAFVGRLPRLLADSANEFYQIDFTSDLDQVSQSLQNGTGLPGGIQVLPNLTDLLPACGTLGLESLLGGLLLAGFVTRRWV